MTQEVNKAERRTDVRDAIQDLIMDALHNDAEHVGELADSRPVADYGLTLHFTDGDVVHVLVLSEPDQLGDATALDGLYAAIPMDLANQVDPVPGETPVMDVVQDAFQRMAMRWQAVNRLYGHLEDADHEHGSDDARLPTGVIRELLNLPPYRPEEPAG